MVLNIDYNRGVQKQIGANGVEIYMYMDEPGVYRSAHGSEVSVDLARAAGYPVDELGKKRLIRERQATAMEKIAAELDFAETQKKVVKERQGFKLVDIGYGRFHVESPDGQVLHEGHLPKKAAETLLEQLTPKEDTPVS